MTRRDERSFSASAAGVATRGVVEIEREVSAPASFVPGRGRAAAGADAAISGARANPTAFDGCRLPDAAADDRGLDPDCALRLIRDRYQSFREHRESGDLVEEIDLGDDVVRRTEMRVDCLVRDGRFVITTTARRIRTLFGRIAPVRTGPGTSEAAREMDQWLVPHAVLDRDAADEFDASTADHVRLDKRDFVRLELDGPRSGDRIELLVNPETVVVERARGERTLPDGGRWRGELTLDAVSSVEPFEATDAATDPRGPADGREVSDGNRPGSAHQVRGIRPAAAPAPEADESDRDAVSQARLVLPRGHGSWPDALKPISGDQQPPTD